VIDHVTAVADRKGRKEGGRMTREHGRNWRIDETQACDDGMFTCQANPEFLRKARTFCTTLRYSP